MKTSKVLMLANIALVENNGVSNKLKNQRKAAQKVFASADLMYIDKVGAGYTRKVLNNSGTFEVGRTTVPRRFFLNFHYKQVLSIIENYDIILIRHNHFANPFQLWFFQKLKKSGKKVIVEIPNFPYDGEYLPSIKNRMKLLIDSYYLRKNAKYVDFFIFYNSWKIVKNSKFVSVKQYIQFTNSIFVNADPHLNVNPAKLDEERPVVFLGVANLCFWHGYDRLIRAVGQYRENGGRRSILFKIVGDGPELNQLKELSSELKVNQYVQFIGPLHGVELENELSTANIGVDSLARFRVGNLENDSIKSKEYLIFGLPVIKSHRDPSIEDLSIVYSVSHNEETIVIEDIIRWHDSITRNSKMQAQNFSKENFSWLKQYQNLCVRIQNS